jgi:hypothetical protein
MVMTHEERAMLDALCAADDRSAGDWVRVAVKDAYRARFGEKKPKTSKK